jgi:SulP family sulfate permease
LRLRGRTTLGATFFIVVADYARHLRDVGGRLYLSGIDPEMAELLRDVDLIGRIDSVRLYAATDEVGASTASAVDDAETWLVEAPVDP